MANGIYSVRLDGELADWIEQQITKHKRGSDVIREAIICAMGVDQDAKAQSSLVEEGARKSISAYRMLEAFISNPSAKPAQVLDIGKGNSLKDFHTILHQEKLV